MASTLRLSRNGAVGFIDWLDAAILRFQVQKCLSYFEVSWHGDKVVEIEPAPVHFAEERSKSWSATFWATSPWSAHTSLKSRSYSCADT